MENKNLENEKREITPKHFFLHIFTIIMLYLFTVNLIVLLFQYINFLAPDLLSRAVSSFVNKEIIRFSLSSIIIIFPVFFLSSWLLQKSYKNNPAVEKMKIKKWLVYFTLFIGAIVVVFNLVTAVLWFLNGEITLRFMLKSLSLLVVIGLIFTYYGRDTKEKISSSERKYWAAGVIFIFFLMVIGGFFLAGSPQKERLSRFDRQKIEDLNGIQWQIVSFFQKKERLPEDLVELEDLISGYRVPKDTQNDKPYEYFIKGEDSFELCAEFNLASEEEEFMVYFYDYNWSFSHGPGRECFIRTIDKEIYPSLTPDGRKIP